MLYRHPEGMEAPFSYRIDGYNLVSEPTEKKIVEKPPDTSLVVHRAPPYQPAGGGGGIEIILLNDNLVMNRRC